MRLRDKETAEGYEENVEAPRKKNKKQKQPKNEGIEDRGKRSDWSGGVRVMTPDMRRRTRRRQETREARKERVRKGGGGEEAVQGGATAQTDCL